MTVLASTEPEQLDLWNSSECAIPNIPTGDTRCLPESAKPSLHDLTLLLFPEPGLAPHHRLSV